MNLSGGHRQKKTIWGTRKTVTRVTIELQQCKGNRVRQTKKGSNVNRRWNGVMNCPDWLQGCFWGDREVRNSEKSDKKAALSQGVLGKRNRKVPERYWTIGTTKTVQFHVSHMLDVLLRLETRQTAQLADLYCLFEGSTASHVNQPDQHVCSIPPHSCAPLAGCFHFAVLLKRRYAKCLKKTPKAGGEINLTVLKIFSFGLNRHMNPHLFGVNKGGVFCLKGNLSQEHRWSPALRFVLLFFLIIDFTYWCETAKRNTRSSAWGWKQEVWSWFRAAGVNVTGRGRREICGDITQGPCVKPVSVQTEIILLVLIHSYRHNWGLLSLEH